MALKIKSFIPPALLVAFVFGSAMVLFLELQPFVLFNADDWQYISIQRKMLPLPGNWNPTRIFPEVFMPFCANVAAYIIMPFTGDYVEALSIECAFVYSAFIAVYVGLFYSLLRKRFVASVSIAVFAALLFYLLHFIAMDGASHLFHTDSVTNLFYYALSNYLCCSLVLFEMRDRILDDIFSKRHIVKKGIFLALLYWALFSNIFASIVVAAYVGIDLLLRLFKAVRKRERFRSVFITNISRLLILAIWAIVQVLEANGGRANSFKSDASPFDNVVASFCGFFQFDIDPAFVGLIGVIAIATFFMVLRHYAETRSDPRLRMIVVMVLASIIVAAYLIMLGSCTRVWYIQRLDVVASFFFFFISAAVFCLVMLLSRYSRLVLVMPILILFVAFHIDLAVDNVSDGLSSEARSAVTNEIISQVQEGVDGGKNTVEVHVPVFEKDDNWPLADYAAYAFSRSLYRHGMIEHLVKIKMIQDVSMNEEYGIPVPERILESNRYTEETAR